MEKLLEFANLKNRDKAVFIGLFLSKFSKAALDVFGFSSYRQAYNVLGFALGVQPNSINNYRDEFDPYFPNGRQGWHNRALRDYCKTIMENAKDLSFEQFVFVVHSYLSFDNIDLNDVRIPLPEIPDKREFSAERLITGKAAEEYFVQHYQSVELFKGYDLYNTTNLGCGFDFKLSKGLNRFYVEVKGMNANKGNILMTEKEYNIASKLQDKYCLFVVRNFREKPFHAYYFDPLHSDLLEFKKQERQITQTSYTGLFL